VPLNYPKPKVSSQVWWHTAVLPAPGRLRQEDLKFKAKLGLHYESKARLAHRNT
jgi:hypothetical protein